MILLANYLGGLTPHVPAIASLPGSGLVTQIRRLCLSSAQEAEPPKQHSQVEPGNEITRYLGGETPQSIRQQYHKFPG